MPTQTKNLIFIVLHLVMGFGMIFCSTLQKYVGIGHFLLILTGYIGGFACIYVYIRLILNKRVTQKLHKMTWTISGIYIAGMLFTLLKHGETVSPPTLLWMLIGLLAATRIGMFFLQIKLA